MNKILLDTALEDQFTTFVVSTKGAYDYMYLNWVCEKVIQL